MSKGVMIIYKVAPNEANSLNNHKNIIHINGRTYDARSGMLVSDIIQSANKSQNKPKYMVDSIKPPLPKNSPSVSPSTPKNHHTLTRPNPHKSRKLHKSQTLMRKGVKKPINDITSPKTTVTKRLFHNQARQTRAQTIATSPYIKKYHTTTLPIKKISAPLQVQTPPSDKTNKHTPDILNSIQPPPRRANQQKTISQSEELFNNALQSITQTKTPKKTTKHRKISKITKIIISMTIFTLVIGIVGYLNMPQINLRLASAKAGFSAILPNEQLANYQLDKYIEHTTGQIKLNFKSDDGKQSYQLKQEKSSWNSQSLREHLSDNLGKSIKTVQDGGKTVFLYDNNNATWVNGGIWYTITSQDLSTNQILNLVSNL